MLALIAIILTLLVAFNVRYYIKRKRQVEFSPMRFWAVNVAILFLITANVAILQL